MDKDKSLKEHELKLVFLICGNAGVGKKTFVKAIMNRLNIQEGLNMDNKSFYVVYNFKYNQKIDDHTVSIPIELRILNSKFFIIIFKVMSEIQN